MLITQHYRLHLCGTRLAAGRFVRFGLRKHGAVGNKHGQETQNTGEPLTFCVFVTGLESVSSRYDVAQFIFKKA